MRNTAIVTVEATNRDQGKRFHVREMPAIRAEDWAIRAVLALAHGRSDIPDREQIASMGWKVLAAMGIEALQDLRHDEVKPLLDEMLECVQIMPDPKNAAVVRPLVLNSENWEGDDVEEVSTLWLLRQKVFEVHAAPFAKGAT